MAVLLTSVHGLSAQDPSFFHLEKSDGLTDNTVTSVVSDHDGLIWIGTLNGLNSYDGYSVRNFYTRDYPGLQADIIARLVCDNKNRIWIHAADGRLSLLDEKRQFHTITIPPDNNDTTVDYILPTSNNPMFLNNGHVYKLADDSTLEFVMASQFDEPLLKNDFARINVWDEHTLIFSGNDQLFLFDTRTLSVRSRVEVPGVVAANRLNADTALVTTNSKWKLHKVSFSAHRITKSYEGLRDQFGDEMHSSPGSVHLLHDQQFLITSPTAGIYTFDNGREKLMRYSHDVFDDRTIAANHTTYLFECSEDFYFIATAGSGLSYFKRNANLALTKSVFQDQASRNIYNGYISCIAEDAYGNRWIGASNTLIHWNTTSGATTFYLPNEKKGKREWGRIRTLHISKSTNRVWVGTATGLFVLDIDHQTTTYLQKGSALPDHSINSITESPDGLIWVCTSAGIYSIDPHSLTFHIPDQTSPFKAVQNLYCNILWFQDNANVWVGTRSGAYHANLSTGNAKSYTTSDGLIFNEVTGLAGDQNNVYIGTRFGFHTLEKGKSMQAYKHLNEVWPVDCHAMLKDKDGNIWFANRDYLAAYSPSTRQFTTFDDRAGINPSGFHFYAAMVSENGELVFGSNRGITYFRPKQIQAPGPPTAVLIYEMESPNHLYQLTPNLNPELKYADNSVSFSFSAINLLRGKNLFYQYRLDDGEEGHWTKISAARQQVAYHNLQPGRYTFDVRASANGVDWVEASNPVSFVILTPWWKKDWFLLTCLLTSSVTLALLVWRRNNKLRYQREQLEIEQTINYLATSLHDQQTIDAMLWDVAKNCIGRLKFEDCVIYLIDEQRNVLEQKAACGPKTTRENKIVNPIEIPLGKGIVGNVAVNAKAEIIEDTAKDRRYIVDDAVRQSEIAVPIIYDNRVLGVIDSEHARRGFFTQKHLSILTTIAALCANKIVRLTAEAEKQKAQMELLVHERKTVEAQLKSLRLQMNPHFLFNSLNSIQQMILAGDETSATRYLSKFSRLLRLVLAHADKETLRLKEEFDTLQLYLELESLRFKGTFDFTITHDETIDLEEIRIPAMLVQPFVENAIWHGLLHKQGERKLSLHFSEGAVENLVCIIEDNGIGRTAAGKVSRNEHTGKGIATATERLSTYNEYSAIKTGVWIEDLQDKNCNGMGTRVTLTIPSL